MPEPYMLSIAPNPKGPGVLAIISSGGHPQIPGSGTCNVLDANVLPNRKEAKRWYRQAIVAQSWKVANDDHAL